MFTKPKRLHRWDIIWIVTPSRGLPSMYPQIFEAWINTLLQLGFKVRELPHARYEDMLLYNNPKLRADDINNAFADTEISAIFTSIWWDDCIRILPYLDIELIKRNPKVFLWYSDTTIINTFLNQAWLVTFNGPSVMAWFSQWNDHKLQFHEDIQDFFFSNKNFIYSSYDYYSNGYPSWKNSDSTWKLKEHIPNTWCRILQWTCAFEWHLFGGCIEVLEFMKSTPYWPHIDFWNGKILFLDISADDGILINQVKCILRNYAIQGVLHRIAGLLIWRARNYSEDDKRRLEKVILDVISWEFWIHELPIITNLDFWHTDPQWILPLGIMARFDTKNIEFKLIESPFID